MKPRRRNQRLILLALGGAALTGAALLAATALSQNLDYFYSPEDIEAGRADPDKRIRLGGLVAEGSVRNGDGVAKVFEVTDGIARVTITYDGILPDLFREGQGVIAQGRMNSDGIFHADIILAKHDENYKPKELKTVLDKIEARAKDTVTKPANPY